MMKEIIYHLVAMYLPVESETWIPELRTNYLAPALA